MEYCFGKSSHRVEAPHFDPAQHNLSVDSAKATNINRNFPFLPKTLLALPNSIAVLIGGGLAAVAQQKEVRTIFFSFHISNITYA